MAHPDFYLPGGRIEAPDLASRLAGDALARGAARTLTAHQDLWWIVAADIDWLAEVPVPVEELFRRIALFPQSGPNSMRSEVLIAAFAQRIVTWCKDRRDVIKGNNSTDLPSAPSASGIEWKRVVAVQLAAKAGVEEPAAWIAAQRG